MKLSPKIRRVLASIFSIRKLDGHCKISFLGLRANFRYNPKINWPVISEKGVSTQERKPRLIASLTSIPKRIEGVSKVVSSLLAQKCKPDMLILWLAREEFPEGETSLPQDLLRLKDFGLQIKWCNNLRSYKKLVPALREYPEDIIMTFDDDIYYAPDVIENLYNSYKKYPDAIHCYRAGRISLDENDKIQPMSNKILMYLKFDTPSFLNVIMSGTGTLFPPKSLHSDILDENIFMNQLPTNDEIFFWAMAVRNNTKVVNVKNFEFNMYCLKEAQKYALSNINKPNSQTGVDGKRALAIMLETYPDMLGNLKKG